MASSLSPADAEIRALAAENRWSEIAQRFSRTPTDEVAHAATAIAIHKACVDAKDEALAESWLDRVLVLAPTNATYWRNKGNALQKRGQLDAALDAFEHAVGHRPDIASYHASCGIVLAQLDQHAKAAEALERALAIDAAQRAWWIRLARARVQCGALPGAAEAYRRALALQPDSATQGAYDELQRQMHSGSKAASSSYYDAVFADSVKYARPGQESDYAPVWRQIAAHLGTLGARNILDLGCGPGQFAEFIATELPGVNYCGIDFSAVAIRQARERCPGFRFEQRELPLADLAGLPSPDVIVCTEVLEHVEADREILAALPAALQIVASVPDYDSFGHLRIFRSEDAVRLRYGDLIEGLEVRAHALDARHTLWLMSGRTIGPQVNAPEPEAPAPVEDASAEAAAIAAPVGRVDVCAAVVEAVFLTDGTRYVEEFLPMFGLPFVPVVESIGRPDGHVALRHDVDWSIENALAMAELEHQQGIRSSYYLLHPDGDVQKDNYFGRIVEDQLEISPHLFDWARRLVDLGHEVGLHNDLITLSLTTGRAPGEFLEQMLEAFTRAGLPIRGTVAHGSQRGRALGYMNYQVFSDFTTEDIALDYRDRTELLERFAQPFVEADGCRVEKFALRMADYGLQYEANFVPRELYLSDSSSRLSFWVGDDATRFDKFAPASDWHAALQQALGDLPAPQRVQCLVHACHWGPLSQFNAQAVRTVRGRRDRAAATEYRGRMRERLLRHDNVLHAETGPRFEGYDQKYAVNANLYNIPPTVRQFMNLFVAEMGRADNVLEVGCGQGELLAFTVDAIAAAHDGRRPFGLGVDGSASAILACAGRYPSLAWHCGALESFVAEHDAGFRSADREPPRYDLVLDKTGTIFIPDPETARTFLANLERCMAPGAHYVYIASRNYYFEVLSKRDHGTWAQDWLALVADVFEPISASDDDLPELKGYLKRVFRRRP